MEAASACEIARLPEDLLSLAISLTTPRDACRSAAVSPAFRAAADSDAVWSCFLPRNLPKLADGRDLSRAQLSRKGLYLRLADRPVILADGTTSMWLDRESGVKCFMLSARKMSITWGDTPRYWRWIPITGSSFSNGAELLHVWWLEMGCKIDSKMLSPNSTYCAYLVFKIAFHSYGLQHPEQKTSVSLGGSTSTRHVRLAGTDSYSDDSDDDEDYGLGIPEDVLVPRERDDGWNEVELGEFYNDEGRDGEVCISLNETSATVKCGLIVQGIEIRPKNHG